MENLQEEHLWEEAKYITNKRRERILILATASFAALILSTGLIYTLQNINSTNLGFTIEAVSAIGAILMGAAATMALAMSFFQSRRLSPREMDAQFYRSILQKEMRQAASRGSSVSKDEFTKRFREIQSKIEEIEKSPLSSFDQEGLYGELIKNLAIETKRSRNMAWVNLLIAIFFALFAIWVLFDYMPQVSDYIGGDESINLALFLPRIALSITNQGLAFFFLRLYARNEERAQFNKNERTNIDLWMISLLSAQNDDHKESLNAVQSRLSQVDRNKIYMTKGKIPERKDSEFIEVLHKLIDRISTPT